MAAQESAPMTKVKLIRRLADKLPHLPANDVESAINILVENLSSTLAAGERIDVRGFGSFSNRYRPARLGRNPSTGAPVAVAARYAIYFKPGRELKERVNGANRVGTNSVPLATGN
jgi:integration host factor subunit beta